MAVSVSNGGVIGIGRTWALTTVLAAALLAYATVAVAFVDGESIVEVDERLAGWIAEEMPTWAEWLARPFTWLGGYAGLVPVVGLSLVWLVRQGRRADATILFVVACGIQLLVLASKQGYERARPDAGSAIALPTSFSFPSGHAANGVAIFGLLGLLLAVDAPRRRHLLAIVAGFALGLAIGASRIVLNVHYLGDVLAGASLGLAWVLACLLVARLVAFGPWRRRYDRPRDG